MNTLLLRESFSDKLFYNTWQKHCTKLLWEGFSLKVSILKTGPLKINLNVINKVIFVSNYIKKERKTFNSNLELNQIIDGKRF